MLLVIRCRTGLDVGVLMRLLVKVEVPGEQFSTDFFRVFSGALNEVFRFSIFPSK